MVLLEGWKVVLLEGCNFAMFEDWQKVIDSNSQPKKARTK